MRRAIELDPSINTRRIVPLGRASNSSLEALSPLLSWCAENGVDFFIGANGRKEWFLRDGETIFMYDFCVPSAKLIVEFHGRMFHPPEECDSWQQLFSGKSADEVRERDEEKKELALSRGFSYFVIWEGEEFTTKISEILQLLDESVKNADKDENRATRRSGRRIPKPTS